MLKPYLKYLKSLARHKYYVGVACFKLGLYWRGIKHDMSKLSPSEIHAYAAKFGTTNINSGRDASGYYDPTQDQNFKHAWNHHIHNNPHHWQYWCTVRDHIAEEFATDNPDDWGKNLAQEKHFISIISMPEPDILEMFCDWWGASKAYSGKNGMLNFWNANKNKLRLSDGTRKYIETHIQRVSDLLGE